MKRGRAFHRPLYSDHPVFKVPGDNRPEDRYNEKAGRLTRLFYLPAVV
jgi:hypothetical protein